MNSSLIRLNDISFTYPGGSRPVLDHLNLEINAGDCIGMMAPNGSGKTTLVHTIMGLCRPQAGQIEIFGKTMEEEGDFAPIRTQVGLLFQDSDDQLFCPSVLDDVAFGPLNQGLKPKEAKAKAEAVLERLEITRLRDAITHRLSGGQKRMVALAAVLALEPKVLLLDEPTAGLDQEVKDRLAQVLRGLETTYMVISHEFDFVEAVADRIFTMEKGRILTDDEIHLHRHEHFHRHGNHPHNHD
ncbi:MAG: energy-coupling factor ABC transporter ATP-binding protein [Desulfobacterales bacterium]|nr:energy-coupling factor ABC transporter ATP-binding protein [Desulfobacterales bacterium]